MSFSDESFATLKCSIIDNTKVLLKYDKVLFKIYFIGLIFDKYLSDNRNVSSF